MPYYCTHIMFILKIDHGLRCFFKTKKTYSKPNVSVIIFILNVYNDYYYTNAFKKFH